MNGKKINDGGAAFPFTHYDRDSVGEMGPRYTDPGMTLRDWMAGQALAGVASSVGGNGIASAISKMAKAESMTEARVVAQFCYEYADAMIAYEKGERHDG